MSVSKNEDTPSHTVQPGGRDDGLKPALRPDNLGRVRLLVVLDALLREGSVSGAASSLGVHSAAISRMLPQLRQVFGDALFIRTGKGLMPTPFAEMLRQRVRAIVAQIQHIMDPALPSQPQKLAESHGWEHELSVEPVPLAVQRGPLLQGEPSPMMIARKLGAIGHNAEPGKRLAKYIATTAAGAGQSRPLTLEEAEDAMCIMLAGDADPVQLGALLSAIGYRGVAAAEVAGFVMAARKHIGAYPAGAVQADLDWPAYLSPKVRAQPWFLHAARLVAGAGYKVMLHGHFGRGKEAGKFELAATLAGIPVCASVDEARAALAAGSIAYLPLGAMSGQLHALMSLYPLVEMRLPTNTIVHLLNPLCAPVSLLGVAQPAGRELHRDAARFLGNQDVAIFGNTRDVAEFTPFRTTTIHRLVAGNAEDVTVPSQKNPEKTRRPSAYDSREYWEAVWSGKARDASALAIILSTAAAALLALDGVKHRSFDDAYEQAAELWKSR